MSPSESFHGNPRFLPPVTSARGRKPGALHRQPWPPARGLHRGRSARLRPAPSLLLSGPGASSSCCGRGGGPPLGTAPLRRLRGAVSVARTVGTGTDPQARPSCRRQTPGAWWGRAGCAGQRHRAGGRAGPSRSHALTPAVWRPGPGRAYAKHVPPSVFTHAHAPLCVKPNRKSQEAAVGGTSERRFQTEAFPRGPPGVAPFLGAALSSEGPPFEARGVVKQQGGLQPPEQHPPCTSVRKSQLPLSPRLFLSPNQSYHKCLSTFLEVTFKIQSR